MLLGNLFTDAAELLGTRLRVVLTKAINPTSEKQLEQERDEQPGTLLVGVELRIAAQ
jgi:hypothetical protein